jgi:hypothetical protein
MRYVGPVLFITAIATASILYLVWVSRSMRRRRGEANTGRIVEPSTTEPLVRFLRNWFSRRKH